AWATAAAVVLAAGACVAGLSGGPQPVPTPPPRTAEAPSPKVDALGDPLPPGALARLGTTRFRVGMWPIHLAPSPDGSQVAVVAGNHGPTQYLMILDAATGRTVREVPIRGGWVQWLRWRPSGRGFLLAKVDVSEYVLWEFTDPTAKPPVGDPGKVMFNKGPRSFQNSVPSPDGTRLAADTGRRVAVWPLGKPGPAAVGDPDWAAALPAQVVALHFTPDGKRLVGVAGDPGKPAPVKVWDAATGKELTAFDVPLGHGRAVALSADGTALFAADADGRVSAFDLATGRARLTFDARHETAKGSYEDISRLVPTADGRTLLVFRYGNGADAFDPATGKPRWRTRDRSYPHQQTVGLMPDGKRFVIGGTFGRIAVGDLATGRLPDDRGGLDHVQAVVVAADGRTALTTGNDRAVRRWDLGTGRELGRVDLPPELGGLALSPDGRLAVGLGGPTPAWEQAALLDAATGRTVAALPVDAAELGSLAGSGGPIAWLPDGSVVIAGGKHPSRRFARDGAVVTTYTQEGPAANRHMWAAAASPDGRTVVLASHDRGQGPACAAVYDAATGKQLRAWDPGVQFTAAAFAPDGRSVILTGYPNTWAGRGAAPGGRASGPGEAVVRLDVTDGTGTAPFAVPPGLTHRSTTAPAVSPTGYQVAVAESDHSLTVYEAATGAIRRQLRGHRNEVYRLAFTPDGRRLVSVGRDGTGLVWDVGPPAPAGPVGLAEADRQNRWDALGSANPATADRARGEWAADPDGLAAVAAARLKPVPPPTDAEVDTLIGRLGSDDPAEREAAGQALDRLGAAAVPRAKAILPKVRSAADRRTLTDFVTRAERPPDRLTGVRLHERRAVEVLEAAGSAEAKAVLKGLAGGAAGAAVTREAKSALARLGAARP
ncbi:MAG: PQQ-binding-like beta-propeller repeat protein, partial [Gemmataceae bacterium]|nr:PQQ-binding-like beta-propeller repeat protein [Gemmataceae bacterium]